MCHNYSARALEPGPRNKRSQCGKKPALQLESSPSSLPLEKSLCSHEDPAQPKNNKLNK